MRRVQQASYPMVKLTQAEVAAMIGRREERRKLALEEIERRNNIKNKKDKKRRSKSKDRGLPRIEGKKAVRKLMNSFLGKDHKNNLFGVKDHHDKDDLIRTRERRLSAPNSQMSLFHSSSRSVIGDSMTVGRTNRYSDTISSRRAIGHPNSEMNFPANHRPRSQYGPTQYRRFQDCSFSSFSDTNSMTRRPSIDTISTYLSHETQYPYRYGHASQNGSFYGGSVGSQELTDAYHDEDSVFTDDSYSEAASSYSRHGGGSSMMRHGGSAMMMARSQDRLNSTARMSTRSYSLGRSRVLSDPSLVYRHSSPRHNLHQHSNSDVVSGHVSRGAVRPYSQDLSELQESFERELYVNQRTLTEEIHEHNRKKKKHKYEYIDDEDASIHSDSDEEEEHQFVNPLPLPPKTMLSKSQQSLAISPIRAMSRSQQSLSSSTYSSPTRHVTHSSPYGKRPVPAPRHVSTNGEVSDNNLTPSKRSSARYASNQSLCPTNHVDTCIMANSQLVTKPCHPDDTCFICHGPLQKPGGHDPYPGMPSSVIALIRCQHRFHLNCIRVYVDNNPSSISSQSLNCPQCGRLQRDVLGTMPENGTMSYKVIPKGLPGFENYHSIQITYNFQNGTQSPKHPSPGDPYFAIGFPKTAFLPDTEQGRSILEMLEKSFNLGHTFVVDAGGDIVWGDIPHRTEFGGEPMTESFLDTIMTALFKLGLGASDC